MKPLTNSRHEEFAQALFRGMTASKAYELAGYKAHRGNACRLKWRPDIRKRVNRLFEQAADSVVAGPRRWTKARERRIDALLKEGRLRAAIAVAREPTAPRSADAQRRGQRMRANDNI